MTRPHRVVWTLRIGSDPPPFFILHVLTLFDRRTWFSLRSPLFRGRRLLCRQKVYMFWGVSWSKKDEMVENEKCKGVCRNCSYFLDFTHIATLGSILDIQLSWKSSKLQLAKWSHRVAGLCGEPHPPTQHIGSATNQTDRLCKQRTSLESFIIWVCGVSRVSERCMGLERVWNVSGEF